MSQKISFYGLTNRPKPAVSSSGSKVYNWDYLDKVGNVKHDSRNIYAEIQSFKNCVDYKKLIKDGGIEIGYSDDDLYLDTTKLPDSFTGYCDDISACASSVVDLQEDLSDKSGETRENSKQTLQNVVESEPLENEGGKIEQNREIEQGGKQ